MNWSASSSVRVRPCSDAGWAQRRSVTLTMSTAVVRSQVDSHATWQSHNSDDVLMFLHQQHTHTRLTALCLGLSGWAGTRKVKPIWILLKQETVSGSGTSKSAPHSRQITMPATHHSVFYRPDALPAAQPTASKHWRLHQQQQTKYRTSISPLQIMEQSRPAHHTRLYITIKILSVHRQIVGGSVAEWSACWTQAQKGQGSNSSRDAVG